MLTFNVQPGVCRQFSQFERVNRLVLCAAVLDLQGVDGAFNIDLVFIARQNLNAVLNPLRSSHILMGQLQAEDGILSLDHVQVLHGLLHLHS